MRNELHPYNRGGRTATPKRIASDANAWAEKLRRERQAREAVTKTAPVVIKEKP